MEKVVDCHGLSKTYRTGTVALDGLEFSVEKGAIHGLVGRNGAGKTTLMKCLFNLIRPTSGTINVFGQPAGLMAHNVGGLIEMPAFYNHLNGRQNLALFAGYFGVDGAECGRILELVGLANRAGEKASRYSLGMKQRLGIAIALLGKPELLILDEPVNGLDPQAIAETRDLMRTFRESGTTILLSSHLLGEIEQVCDTVTVLEAGKLVATGTPGQLRQQFNGQAPFELQVGDLAKASQLLGGMGVKVEVEGSSLLAYLPEDMAASDLVRALVNGNIEVGSVKRRDSLEAAYLSMTRKEQ
ncbi:ABC transporter ATP-binding protein [Trueperella pyogenes]|uniref:ABC transporter ATP-binding protein n=2 Tax=Trueperella pyogenes TaxID=1661 RepID=A0A3Q9GFU8_9ACTO|nr:ABC transporter ATP-binding protein [Trueperella pyogenes]AWG03889.1 ABC transporter ATP-binding protein [Trueperella pyogenes]AWG16620.1 ABC transporter ATP-binding protein [Trueperella pyogenes]AZR05499.1 ABC transporter ATP-binding protein [Trueperella pyogenes]AZR06868.1 ABC transporter ATP-binding protein [Trueperella pyogenes]QIU87045.1 ABC transporter ATP-binding protein [Trueperella pyogenes]